VWFLLLLPNDSLIETVSGIHTHDARAVLLGIIGDNISSLSVNPYASVRELRPVFLIKKKAILLPRLVFTNAFAEIDANVISHMTFCPKQAKPSCVEIKPNTRQRKNPKRVTAKTGYGWSKIPMITETKTPNIGNAFASTPSGGGKIDIAAPMIQRITNTKPGLNLIFFGTMRSFLYFLHSKKQKTMFQFLFIVLQIKMLLRFPNNIILHTNV
jgi:hypothetical protein